MFERFTDRARRAIVDAQDAAREMGHSQISPEHLLIGLQQGEGLAAKAMAQAGVDLTTLAAILGHTTTIELLLLSEGTDVNAQSSLGYTPLTLASLDCKAVTRARRY